MQDLFFMNSDRFIEILHNLKTFYATQPYTNLYRRVLGNSAGCGFSFFMITFYFIFKAKKCFHWCTYEF